MKQFILTLMIAMFAVNAMADKADTLKVSNGKGGVTITHTNSSKGNKKDSTFMPTYIDTAEDGTTVISTMVSTTADADDDSYTYDSDGDDNLESIAKLFGDGKTSMAILSMGKLIIFLFLILPILIVLLPIILLVIYLRHRDRRQRERDRLIEKAIEAGQPLPKDIADNVSETSAYSDYNDARNKGIRNMCLGVGLFIFLWALDDFSLGCIGILVFCWGLGKYLTGGQSRKTTKTKTEETKTEETKPEGTKSEETKQEETKSEEIKPEDTID